MQSTPPAVAQPGGQLKKIDASQLRVGMYVHDLSCDWFTHPFVRNRFLLESYDEIRKIREAGIHDVVIDTSRGIDVPDAPTVEQAERAADAEMRTLVQAAAPPPAKASYRDEYARAIKVRDQAANVVRDVMADVRLGKAVSVEAVTPVVQEITESILRNPGALLGLLSIKNKDDYTFLHSVSVCALLVAFCHHRGMDAETIRQAGIGGLLHDAGKAAVPDAILNKPGKLTDEEFAIMRKHPRAGYDVLKASGLVGPIPLDIALYHHERCDGSGYPERLPDEHISDLAQMAAIVDVYDALTSQRCYHDAMPAAAALRKLYEWSKFHFRPALVQDFMRCIGIYPVGTLVMLSSGRLGVVFEPTPGKPLAPKVNTFFNTRTNVYIKPEVVDLSLPRYAEVEKIVGQESPRQWKVDPLRFLPA
jgi:HD-GYP domain-containing protein (c-di-GMP phosphodiesterase class II)